MVARPKSLRVVLVRPKEEGNVGSVARAMKNFGFKELVLVDPCKLDADARRFASHGRDVLKSAKKVKTFKEAIKGCSYVVGTTGKSGGQKTPLRQGLIPEQIAERVAEATGKVALVFGNETSGLSNKDLELCDTMVRIPTNPKYPILNLAQAVCIMLYELAKKRFVKTVLEKPPTDEEKEAMKRYLHEMISTLYDQEHRKKMVEENMNKILGKLFLNKGEVNTVTSVCRKVLDAIPKED